MTITVPEPGFDTSYALVSGLYETEPSLHLTNPIILLFAPVDVVLNPTYPLLPAVASKKNKTASLAESPGTPKTLYDVKSPGLANGTLVSLIGG